MNSAFRMIAALALAVGSVALTAAAPAETDTVHIANFTFSGAALSVKVGTTVTWVNDDDVPHTVVARNGAFRSKALDSGDRFSFTFAKAGEYAYFCSLHPHMTGKISVGG